MKSKVLHRLYSLPLRAHLLMMALFLSLPAIGLIVKSGMDEHKGALRKGFSETRRASRDIAKELYNLAGNAEQLLMALEQIPEIERRDKKATDAILAAILEKNKLYGNIIIADENGEVWASALPMTGSFSIRDRRSFQQAIKTRGFASGDFTVGMISRRSTIGFSYPIIGGSGKLKGVISANINFEGMKEQFPLTSLPSGSSFTAIDRNGRIVARNLDPARYLGTKLRDGAFQRMITGPKRATYIDADLTDEKKIVSYQKLQLHEEDTPYLYIRIASPLKSVMEKARQALLLNLAILSSMLVLAVASVVYLGNIFFVKRIEKLHQAAQRMAEGDLDARVRQGDEGGEIGRLGVVFNDMARNLSVRQATLLKRDQELRELNRNLVRRVEEETERRVNHERLLARHARLVAMGEMIGAIAHQWRQPLATMGATVQSIRMAWERGCLDEPFLKRAEQDAQKQLYYMSDTIEDFRNFFSPEKVAERFNVKEKVEEVLLLVSPQFTHSGVKLEAEYLLGDAPLYIMGYKNEFKQSLLNLVSNALDAVIEKRSGGSGEAGKVTVSLAAANDKVVVEVLDDGCGIPPQHADKIFDPYFTTKAGEKGTGIGLYMTRLIIEESMAGALSFTSGEHGTMFRMELTRDFAHEAANG